ncbi:MAG: acetate--CoA ligase family protein [Patescibacteria group bacterium]|mgnify:CR=1 FL=1
MNLQPLLNPKSIAVVGASRERGKVGNVIFRNCRQFGYRGMVYPVNPKAARIEAVRAYPSVSAIPKRVDLVIIATPAAIVPLILKDAIRAKAKSAMVISAGFSETGAKGKTLENEIAALARRAKLPLVGPNCLGLLLPHRKLNASFAAGLPKAGSVSILSQSGAMAVAEMDWAAGQQLGFRAIISVGNKAVLREADYLAALGKDAGTKVILMYLEDIRDGRKFLETAQHVAVTKPIVILRAGRSAVAAKAAQSHTGALAGSSAVTDALLRQAGCVVVDTIEAWFALAAAFAVAPRPKGNRLAILTNAGGPGILATDALPNTGLTLAAFTPATAKRLRKVLPSAAALHNPVDVVGDAPPERYAAALKAVIADRNIDVVVSVLTDQLVTRSSKVAQQIIRLHKKSPKPILAAFVGGPKVAKAIALLRAAGVPAFAYPELAVQAAGALVTGTRKSALPIRPLGRFAKPFRASNVAAVGEQAQKMLGVGGIRVLPVHVVRSAKQAVSRAAQLHYPVVMKLDAPSVLHKTEKGAVALDLHTPAMVTQAFHRFRRVFARQLREAGGRIVLQDQRRAGVELIIGAVQDPQFGPVVLVGFGGIYTEALRSVDYIAAPCTPADARIFLQRAKVWSVLTGARGQIFAVTAVVDLLVRVSQFIARHPEVQALDLNPVLVTHQQAIVVDARLTFTKP